jgi:hypothetical protein
MEFGSCQQYGAQYFEVVPRYLENLCTPVTGICINIPTHRLIYELEISSYGKMLPYVKFSLQAYLFTDFKERENKAT